MSLNFHAMNKKNSLFQSARIATLAGLMTASTLALSFADATSTATTLGTGISNFLDTMTSVSLVFLTNSTLITASVIAMFVFGVLYWIKRKVL